MKPTLKPLDQQVILITGASSGIGLTTAIEAAKRGARVMMVARSEEALRHEAERIREAGGEADFAVADVADLDQLRRAAEATVARFGRIDTWVNNAGVSIYGKLEDVKVEDDRRLFDTNFWGVVNGSRIAMEYLRDRGGALVNVGSVVSDRAIPLQGMYSASKHAVLGFTDALRMEVDEAGAPISVTLVKPSSIDTPFPKHAKNYMDVEPTLPPPVYAPEVVAEQILHAAVTPVREIYAGGGGRVIAGVGRQMPGLMDWLMGLFAFRQQRTDRPAAGNLEGSLHHASNDERTRGDAARERMVRQSSLYGMLSRRPLVALTVLAGVVALGAAAAVSNARRAEESSSAGRAGGGRRESGRKQRVPAA